MDSSIGSRHLIISGTVFRSVVLSFASSVRVLRQIEVVQGVKLYIQLEFSCCHVVASGRMLEKVTVSGGLYSSAVSGSKYFQRSFGTDSLIFKNHEPSRVPMSIFIMKG